MPDVKPVCSLCDEPFTPFGFDPDGYCPACRAVERSLTASMVVEKPANDGAVSFD